MSEINHFRYLPRAPKSEIAVLLTTFGLTVFADLTIAVGMGMVLASVLFIKRMTEFSNVGVTTCEFHNGDDLAEMKGPNAIARRQLPPDVG